MKIRTRFITQLLDGVLRWRYLGGLLICICCVWAVVLPLPAYARIILPDSMTLGQYQAFMKSLGERNASGAVQPDTSQSPEHQQEPDNAVAPSGEEYDSAQVQSGEMSFDRLTAHATTLADLTAVAKPLDNKMVSFNGEAVGDIIDAHDGMKWVLVEDNGAALSCLMTDEQAAQIDTLGRYEWRGTWLHIEGIYHIADAEESGELDVRAYKVAVLEAGKHQPDKVHWIKLFIGIFFLVVAAGLTMYYNALKKRSA